MPKLNLQQHFNDPMNYNKFHFLIILSYHRKKNVYYYLYGRSCVCVL